MEPKEGKQTNEERWFGYYLDELLNRGYIERYQYQPNPIVLCQESEHPFKKFQEKIYTPDFHILWNPLALDIFVSNQDKRFPFYCDLGLNSRIDVKGSGFKFGLNNSDVTFPDRQAWLWSKYHIFIQKVEVSLKKKSIFEKTFLPKRIKEEEIYTTTGKTWTKGDSKVKFNALTLQEYVDLQKNMAERRRKKSK